MREYDNPLTPEQIANLADEDIDFSDVEELGESFWQNAERVDTNRTEQVTLRVKRSVLAHFKSAGQGYRARMNQVLESHVRAQQKNRPRRRPIPAPGRPGA